jgi:hypothetical protein
MARQQKNQFDQILEQLVGNLVLTVNSMPVAGAMAGKVKLTKAEQRARYLQNRDTPAFWNDIVAKHGKNGAYEYWKQMSEKEQGNAVTTPTSE